ncbi:MAG: gamma-glutamylcyclotransferase [Leptolyngbyaceae cyanobacterium SM2_5_2]|nr:gamma-glutamylcyclotransferase [Leptolyngbyaceae cyanobacterium SM2_5_2]
MVPSMATAQLARVGAHPKSESSFYYFAYGSCMCPVDLKRSLGENTHDYILGPATLQGYRLGFHYYSAKRQCGALDILPAPGQAVQGVLYRLPCRLGPLLDQREGTHQGAYRHEHVAVHHRGKLYPAVRTYVVVHKTPQEVAPNDWYFSVVLRGAVTCNLPEQYCWQLFNYMRSLQAA